MRESDNFSRMLTNIVTTVFSLDIELICVLEKGMWMNVSHTTSRPGFTISHKFFQAFPVPTACRKAKNSKVEKPHKETAWISNSLLRGKLSRNFPDQE